MSLNVIALISGGKDSLYSILHCIRNGHNVVALANLHPAPSPNAPHTSESGDQGQEQEEEDIDSFMYQTIGHSIIPLYEKALSIPLYRGAIAGSAVDTSRIYRSNDPTPTQPADSGSNTPTDSNEDETESLIPLLKRILQAHPEANAVCAGAILSTYQRTRIEDVAARLRLTPLAWLWMYPSLPGAELLSDMAAVGCEARIVKVASGVWTRGSCGVMLRMGWGRRGGRWSVLWGGCVGGLEGVREKGLAEEEGIVGTMAVPEVSQARDNTTWTISNVTAPEAGPGAGEQMDAIATKIRALLGETRTPSDIVFTTVLLRDMADFPGMNAVYNSLFDKPNPPARATVACGDRLPHGVQVMVSLVVDLGARDIRLGLHVQSRSYWAPANIGPYSQALSIPLQGAERLVYIAGQIPLEPASMEVAGLEKPWAEGYALRTVLSLQHLWRIGAAVQATWWLGTVAFVTGSENIETKVKMAWRSWAAMHRPPCDDDADEEEPTLDAWDIKYGRRAPEQTETEDPTLPDFTLVESDVLVPPFLAVQVEQLPRGSDIEWQGLGCQCNGLKMAAQDCDHGRQTDTTTSHGLRYTGIEIDHGAELEKCLQGVLETFSESDGQHAVLYTSQPLSSTWPGQIVPCRSVWGQHGRKLAAGIFFQRHIATR
ncbi:adenine nucleotide alpha hydrolases-like protein [Aspergillus campestris IBT 28561]|uniref:Diphthine--ammonia ligase n=1 Tax=Aspergillus campestris (strain IBT 28561) TaxID=1392248 RepID=A0A2I1CRQ3_ASPC2|nr:adenine nucleotide alpha hydrolases-like protein [Aspergillus campestris IBT 28561]PKY00289.1 adenine nucleotide alpha hydrolases-like protein [Aspergillus campestris IBT 28561]